MMNHPNVRAIIAPALAAMFFCMTSCALRKPVTDPPVQQLPPLHEIPSVGTIKPPTSLQRGPTRRVRITRFQVPYDADLAEVWRLCETKGIEPPMGALWRENGLRAHLIHKILLDDFLKCLDQAASIDPGRDLEQRGINTSNIPTPIDLNLGFNSPRRCGLVLSGEQRRMLKFNPGKCRLLIRSQPDQDDRTLIHLTPQFHEPKTTLKPRPILEKQLDGRVFDELALQTRMSATHVLILGLYQPQNAPVWGDTATTEDTPSGSPPATSQPASESEKTPPLSLGRLILAGKHHHKQVQFILALVLDESSDR